MESLPFKIEVYDGLAETEGMARIDGDALLLEFRTRDAILGVVRSDLQEIVIPLSDLASAEYKKGFFGAKLILRGRKLKVLDPVPGSKAGEVGLGIARKYRETAEEFALALAIRITEHGIRRLDERLMGE
jgi:hypothetical protein